MNPTQSEIVRWNIGAMSGIEPDDLSYLALTGKVELPVRDQMAIWCQRQFPDLVVAREWNRHDLVLLADAMPRVVIEGKLWASFNVLDSKKLNSSHPRHGIRGAMERDIEKMLMTNEKYGSSGFVSILVMGIDVSATSSAQRHAVKYLNYWKKFSEGPETCRDRHARAVSDLASFCEKYGPTDSASLVQGDAYGARVNLSVVVTKVTGGIDAD